MSIVICNYDTSLLCKNFNIFQIFLVCQTDNGAMVWRDIDDVWCDEFQQFNLHLERGADVGLMSEIPGIILYIMSYFVAICENI